MPEVERRRHPAAARRDAFDALDRRRASTARATAHRRRRSTSAARSSRRRTASGRRGSAARAGGRVDEHELAVGRRAVGPADVGHDAGRRLVVGPAVRVDVGVRRCALGMGAGGRLDDLGLVEMRRGRDDRGELRGELAERQVLAAALDQAERRRVPERRRAAVAEQHLVARRGARRARARPSRARRTTERTPSRRWLVPR